jgi:transcriptional regulator GlxA family with amidase domain
MTRLVTFVVYPQLQVLDLTGPHEVFSLANRVACDATGGPAPYELEVVARGTEAWVGARGTVQASGGLRVGVDRAVANPPSPGAPAERDRSIDTLLVAGGAGSTAASHDGALVAWLRAVAPGCRRVGAICTGAFVLAAAGLLDGRRATTHWAESADLQARFPAVRVEPDPIFVRDGSVVTSAGVTAGIDLALALVEEDLGAEIAREVARVLVVFVQRPGGQAQFSAQLAAATPERRELRDLLVWIVDHPGDDLSAAALADRAGMSPRHLRRVFRAEVGTTPARYVETVRVEAVRRLLETSDLALRPIARRTGFGTVETLHRAFRRRVGVSPTEYRLRFAATRTGS